MIYRNLMEFSVKNKFMNLFKEDKIGQLLKNMLKKLCMGLDLVIVRSCKNVKQDYINV